MDTDINNQHIKSIIGGYKQRYPQQYKQHVLCRYDEFKLFINNIICKYNTKPYFINNFMFIYNMARYDYFRQYMNTTFKNSEQVIFTLWEYQPTFIDTRSFDLNLFDKFITT
jgi:hypothetical protein